LDNYYAARLTLKTKSPGQAGALVKNINQSLNYSSPPNAVNRFNRLIKMLYSETYSVTVARM
jgi:hypothetical protein